ncbi:MAG: hypothetical protein MPJ22_00655 [Pirellulales bacterium]|nr:hypothetical protein [Pirellulales bacterium]
MGRRCPALRPGATRGGVARLPPCGRPLLARDLVSCVPLGAGYVGICRGSGGRLGPPDDREATRDMPCSPGIRGGLCALVGRGRARRS